MKQLEDMTLTEIRALKERYKKELADCIDDFLKNRPFIKYVTLFRYSSIGSSSCLLLYSNESLTKVIADIEFIKESKK